MNKHTELRKLIQDYLEEAKLMQLATSVDHQPWICSVWFAADEDLNIYWFSSMTRKHSQEVVKNNRVAAAMVVPQTPNDKPRGLQVKGIAKTLTNKKDIEKAISVYKGRIFPKKTIDKLMKDTETPHKFYKITPSQFVLFDAVHFGDTWRQEYNL